MQTSVMEALSCRPQRTSPYSGGRLRGTQRGTQTARGNKRPAHRTLCSQQRESTSGPKQATFGSSAAGTAVALALSGMVQLGTPNVVLYGTHVADLHSAQAAELATATFAAGDARFLEFDFDQLRYAGVTDVVPGVADEDQIEAVQVTYDPARLPYNKLLQTYWKGCQPTQSEGQFKEKGSQYVSAIWAGDPDQAKLIETQKGQLERSGLFGAGLPITTRVIEGPPLTFTPSTEKNTLKLLKASDPKKFKKVRQDRQQYFDKHFGFVQFCKDKVCGYVRFAPACTGECQKVFPEYRETNMGQPELEGDIKITGGSFK